MLADVQRLLDDLFAPNVYNKEIRGALDQSQPTLVFRPATSVWRPDVVLENPATRGMFYQDIDRAYTIHTYNGQVSIALVTLFISMVGEKLPSNGDGIASLCYFLVFAMFISGVTCLCNLVTLKLSSKATSGKPVPSTLQALVNCGKRSTKMLLCTSKNATVNNIDEESNIPETNDFVEIGEKEGGVKEYSQVESRPEVSWMDASRWFDGVCVIITAAFLILGGSMFTYNVINGQIPQ
ncbi:hypothetical protein MAR_024883 [Mya arenaria]|uniref:Neurotransmitter-gated ion-channel transmembrane domain-containing protein n=1 Tax=Mya arenaria TaxID=6604 RepID=A0ABY7DW21_MYAAR|nr:hypothetical protein MAR_024883 [Mya arenaria]